MVEVFTEAMFVENVNSRFRVQNADPPLEIELIEVTSLSSSPTNVQFSILFEGPLQVFLPQQIYRLDHDRLGELDLFLVPIARDDKGFRYEAVFNRMVE